MKYKKILSLSISILSIFWSPSQSFSKSLETNKILNAVDNQKENKTDAAALKKQRINKLIYHYAKLNKVPVKIAHAIIFTESNYKPEAHGKAGEIGLMQLMPQTARGLGFKGPLTDLYNPDINLKFGMRYLAKARKIARGNMCRMILKYNAGYSAKKMNPVSRKYCKKVKKFLTSFHNVIV